MGLPGGPGHVCGVSRTLPRPLPRALALGIALALATARAYRYASLALGSYDLPPAYVSRQGPPRNLAQLGEREWWRLRRSHARAFAQAP